jgi:hypothetical protein
MKVLWVLTKVLLCMPLAWAHAAIPPEIQPELQRRFVSGDYRDLNNITIIQDGVTKSLLESDVNILAMLKLLARGDTTILNHPSLAWSLRERNPVEWQRRMDWYWKELQRKCPRGYMPAGDQGRFSCEKDIWPPRYKPDPCGPHMVSHDYGDGKYVCKMAG